MPDTPSIFDIDDEDAKARALEEARAEFEAGKAVPHSKVRKWLKDLAAGRRSPPPCR